MRFGKRKEIWSWNTFERGQNEKKLNWTVSTRKLPEIGSFLQLYNFDNHVLKFFHRGHGPKFEELEKIFAGVFFIEEIANNHLRG